jgi:hypothetical protein
MTQVHEVTPTDLFVVLDRAFRRRSRGCRKCDFSLPFSLPDSNTWTVEPTASCSDFCRLLLNDIVDEYRGAYRLSPVREQRFRTH